MGLQLQLQRSKLQLSNCLGVKQSNYSSFLACLEKQHRLSVRPDIFPVIIPEVMTERLLIRVVIYVEYRVHFSLNFVALIKRFLNMHSFIGPHTLRLD